MNLIVKMKFGSHLYGTATANSDTDYKGVFIPTKRQLLLGRIPKCVSSSTGSQNRKNSSDDVDWEVYSLHYFLELACAGQTVALDMLHAPDEMLLITTDTWKFIVTQRSRFYTKNLSTFINYARRQASKYGIKGSRLHSVEDVLSVLQTADPESRMREIWDRLPRLEHAVELGRDPNGMRQYQVCGKAFQESATVGYVMPILQRFLEEYGARARLAAENKSIDWKAVSHALRAAVQVRAILTHGTITYPLPEATFLREVKEGHLDYLTVVAPALESLMTEVELLVSQSQLPAQADRKYWEDFLCDTLQREILGTAKAEE